MANTPLTMNQVHFHGIFGDEVLGEVLGAVGGSVLAAGAAEADLQMRETTGDKPFHVRIDQGINVIQEAEDLTVFLEELDYRRIKPRQLFEPLILARIMH